ncbi:Non-specific DNA-binding protein Dps / Iron-binding ferritin-like antioxidant protein / Ferroxidase [Actinomycetales bacterium JB111]|nr:Non-specific DNA-binding protein Dps / Iron-binding ferritin-like antioxidant protein / Ferroxidase [Actinomycetales bacterium JB111]
MASTNEYTVPGLSLTKGRGVADELQHRLHALNDLHLTLKHAHWNVTGPNFIAVHEMLDPQIELVRGYADEVAERIAALGASPIGTPGALVKDRTWEDYKVGRGNTLEHLAAIDSVYTGVVEDHRKAIAEIGEVDPITEDILIGQTAELEKFQWFVRAHLDTRDSEG